MTLSVTAIVIMGVSGSGKSTLGQRLAEATGYRFVEGDDLHPAANVAKMSAGIALTDEDRWPWLEQVADVLGAARPGEGCIISCSALRRAYRDFLRARTREHLLFVFPRVPVNILRARLRDRPNHYMPPRLLESQISTLEPPEPDERVLTIDGTMAPARAVAVIMGFLATESKNLLQQSPNSPSNGDVSIWHAKP